MNLRLCLDITFATTLLIASSCSSGGTSKNVAGSGGVASSGGARSGGTTGFGGAGATAHTAIVGYHAVDNPTNAKIAMMNFGSAGLRVFDIRNPEKPSEVAYYNHGALSFGPLYGPHYYDASRGLIYSMDASNFLVLQLEPQDMNSVFGNGGVGLP
jgi:hypothetical protein